jgi:hypothetical protein
MDDWKRTVEDGGNDNNDNCHPTETLPGTVVIGTRKMTSETVIGSMGGDAMSDPSENHLRHHGNHHSPPYDGGSLSTHDENDDNHGSSARAGTSRFRRRMTAISSSAYTCFGNVRRSVTQRRQSPIDRATDDNHPHDLEINHNKSSDPMMITTKLHRWMQTFVPSTAFRALIRRNMLYRKRNWISTVRVSCWFMIVNGVRSGGGPLGGGI